MYKKLVVIWVMVIGIVVFTGIAFGEETGEIVEKILWTSNVPIVYLITGLFDGDFNIIILSKVDIED